MAVKFVQEIDVDGNVTSDGFVKNGGTSAGFLKADGSVDTSSYTTSAGTVGGSGADNRLPKFSTGGNDVENSTISDNGTTVTMSEGALTLNDASFNIIKASSDLQIVGSTDTVHNMELGSSTVDFNTITLRASNKISYKADNLEKTSIDGNGHIVTVGDVEGTKIVKTGGTSSQFLKADGSVDSNTYLTSLDGSLDGYSESGTNANGDLIVKIGDHSDVYTGAKLTIDIDNEEAYMNGGGFIANNFSLTDGSNRGSMSYSTLTTDRQYTFPDATGTVALTSNIPTNNNQLTNGENYITAGDIPTIPTNNNQLTNGENYITSSSLPTDFVSAASGGTFNGNIVTFGDSYVSGKIGNLDVAGGMGFQFETPSTGVQTMRTDSDAFRVYFGGSGGQLETFHLNQTGELRIKKQGVTKHMFQNDGDAHHDGDVIAYSTTISDERLKDDIKTIENATDTVKNLRGVEYVWNSGHRKGQKEIGVIAQEVQKELPFLVREKEMLDGEKRLTVDYEKMIGLLIESNKELSARLEKLECGCSTCDCK